jgi:hypothetical protein
VPRVPDSGAARAGWLKGFTSVELVFIATMIAADFGFGLFAKPLLSATHVSSIIRLDLIVPTMLMLVTRLVVDKFGTLTLYEVLIACLAMLAWPTSFGLPGPLKLPVFALKGLIWDVSMSALRPWLVPRLFVTAMAGEIVAKAVAVGFQVLLGVPWRPLTQVLWGVQLITTLLVAVVGAALALAVWQAIRDLAVVRRIAAWRSG